mmetsp:Transcript_32401/g.76083  ORF Transcript_32401/g.76083 Transcript_32401/m.76083 type:complete len:143 (+) Transcript_32401:67-495(+)
MTSLPKLGTTNGGCALPPCTMSLPQEQAGTHIRPPPRLLGLSLKVRFDGVVLSKLTWSLAERCRGLRATPSARCRDQHPTHLPVPFLSCYMQRRPFLVVGRVDVGPGPDHGLARAHVAVGSCDVQTGQALSRGDSAAEVVWC